MTSPGVNPVVCNPIGAWANFPSEIRYKIYGGAHV